MGGYVDPGILRELYRLISERRSEPEYDFDETVFVPEGRDDFDFAGILDPEDVVAGRDGVDTALSTGTLTADADGRAEKKGYEFARRDATGGEYGDVEVTLHVEMVAEFSGDAPDPDDLEGGSVSVSGEVGVSNARSESGETPPF